MHTDTHRHIHMESSIRVHVQQEVVDIGLELQQKFGHGSTNAAEGEKLSPHNVVNLCQQIIVMLI